MEKVIRYTTTLNRAVILGTTKVKGHTFVRNIGYVTLLDDEVPAFLFYGCKTLEKVVIPEVTTIGRHAFTYCICLSKITIPNSVKYIDVQAFQNCHRLQSIKLPDNLTGMGWGVFEYCVHLQSISIPKSVTKIPACAFQMCRNLVHITIPEGVIDIDAFALEDCRKLSSITLPNSLKYIGERVFDNCTGLKSINIPESVTIINRSTFYNCLQLESITLPNSLKTIEEGAFYGCSNLSKINIPTSVKSIGQILFCYCNKLLCKPEDNTVQSVLAYKGFDKDLICRSFCYQFGKSYAAPRAKVCVEGFHACLNPLDVLTYYGNINGNRFALVELSGTIDYSRRDSKVAATNIKILKELTFEDLISEFNRLNNN